jgi:hypothetical protein
MWPWGHLAVGYVAFSVFVRFRLGRQPSGHAALALAVATQLPDLIDKPLAWQFGLLSSGISVAHSILVGVPLAFALGIGLWIRDRPELGGALAIGYGSHVSGDLLFATLFSRPPILPSFMWPLYTTPATAPSGFGLKLWELLLNSQALLGSSMGRTYFVLEAVLLVATLALWLSDGAPGLGPVRAFVSSLR